MVSKPWQDCFLYPILVKSSNEKKENTDSQMGQTPKNIFFYFLSKGTVVRRAFIWILGKPETRRKKNKEMTFFSICHFSCKIDDVTWINDVTCYDSVNDCGVCFVSKNYFLYFFILLINYDLAFCNIFKLFKFS